MLLPASETPVLPLLSFAFISNVPALTAKFCQSLFINIAFAFPVSEWVGRGQQEISKEISECAACNQEESSGPMGEASSSIEMGKVYTRVGGCVNCLRR